MSRLMGFRQHNGAMNPKRRVLVADYDTEQAQRFITMLAQAFDVDHVAWLQSAIQTATIRKYDCVLLGLHLPNGQGIDAVTRFMLHVPLVPVIVVADAYDPVVAEQCSLHGAQGYIVKGLATAELLEILIITAIRRQERELVEKNAQRRSLEDPTSAAPAPAQTPTLVKNHVAEINAALRDIQQYIARDAPAHAGAVKALLSRRNLGALTHDIAQLVELDGERFDDDTPVEGLQRSRKASDTALRVVSGVIKRHSDKPAALGQNASPAEAHATLVDVIERRKRFASGAKT